MSGGDKGRKKEQTTQQEGKERRMERYTEKLPSLVNCIGLKI
jgi:hypothetical protein